MGCTPGCRRRRPLQGRDACRHTSDDKHHSQVYCFGSTVHESEASDCVHQTPRLGTARLGTAHPSRLRTYRRQARFDRVAHSWSSDQTTHVHTQCDSLGSVRQRRPDGLRDSGATHRVLTTRATVDVQAGTAGPDGNDRICKCVSNRLN